MGNNPFDDYFSHLCDIIQCGREAIFQAVSELPFASVCLRAKSLM